MFKKILSFFKKKEFSNYKSIISFIQSYDKYLVNDPSTPDLIELTQVPNLGFLKYNVENLNFSPKNKAEQQALNCQITIGNCINYIQKNIKNPIKSWSCVQSLQVFPQAGHDLNAYYDRGSLRFFYYKVKGKTMYTADSSDVVAHELGHALLDAMRPDFWSVQSLEVWSFHEAFSDIVALVSIMQYESVIKKALLETGNDLSKSNSISKLAEEFGILVYKLTGKNAENLSDCLRNPAIEKFKYVDPSSLPAESSNDKLSAECHSFGRVFSAAWYNIFVEVYKKELNKTNCQLQAVKNSRDICFSILINAIPNSPLVSKYFTGIAKSMVDVSKLKYPEYSSIVEKCFIDWNIIKPIKMLSNIKWQDIVYKLKKEDEVIKNNKFTSVRILNKKSIKLNNISILSTNESLNNIEIEVPAEEYYKFDIQGNMIDEIIQDDMEIMNSARCCLGYVEKSIDKMWSIKDGKLVRNYIS
jgi:hypothetical protein